jgi:hypothetical protein
MAFFAAVVGAARVTSKVNIPFNGSDVNFAMVTNS